MYTLADLDPACAPPLLETGDPATWPERRAAIEKVWHEYAGSLPEPLPVAWRTTAEEHLPASGTGTGTGEAVTASASSTTRHRPTQQPPNPNQNA